MSSIAKRWDVRPLIPEEDRAALSRWADQPIIQQLFYNRALYTTEDALAFVKGEVRHTTDPFELADMHKAVQRVQTALANAERIAVYGDYDVDGITSTTLLVQVLQAYKADVIPYIPNRFEEGYGLNTKALDDLQAQGVALVITVDCGIRSLDEAAHARAIGLDMIITDHHHMAETLPAAVAVINPKRPDSQYAEKMLAGVGIAYKLALALMRTQPLPADAGLTENQLLDLVALGTVADLAPLRGENRLLVKRGLKFINDYRSRLGLRALMSVARVRLPVKAGNIGFQLGPRLNAAGRLDSAMRAYELLIASEPAHADELAQALHEQNLKRQELTEAITQKALDLAITADPEPLILFAADPDFNSGVVGLAASRMLEQYHRPALVAQIGAEETTGSARSIEAFHIAEALDRCADLLLRYGGHAAAAGFTLKNDNWPAFTERLREIATEQLADKDLRPRLRIDMDVTLDQMTDKLADQLRYFEPCGYGNPSPLFVARNVLVLSHRTVGKDGAHLKMMLERSNGSGIEAIAFRRGELAANMPTHLDIVFTLEINTWRNRNTLQLNLRDLRMAE